jgi:thiamine transport system permease protein
MNHKAHVAHMPDIQRDTARFYRIMSAPALLILTFLFIIPVGIILSKAFITDDGHFSIQRILTLIRDPYIHRVLRFTVLQALVSTVVSVLIALPGAYLLATFQFRGKSIIRAICTIPFVLPSILVVLGFVIFYGNQGIINSALVKLFHLSAPPLQILYSFSAVILAHAFYNFPIALGLISSFWEQLPLRYDQAAMVLGARKWTVFSTVTLPRLVPAIISAATLIFLFCFSSFVILLVLGGGPQFTTIEVEIYRRARMTLDIEGAAALSLLSIVLTIMLVALHLWSQRLMSHQEEIEQRPERRRFRTPSSPIATISSILYLVLSVVFVLGPLAGIVYRSFQAPISRSGEMAFSVVWYRQLFGLDRAVGSPLGTAVTALITSVTIATIATIISLIVGTLLASRLRSKEAGKGASIELYAMLPMAVSSVVIGLGYYLISSNVSHSLVVSRTLIVLAHTVIASPFVLRSILPEYRKIPKSYTQAALTLGATVPQTFRSIDLPLLRPALATGGAFAFALSMGEINATLILSDSSVVTVPIVMYRLIGSYNYAGACALGTILIFCCAIVFATIERIRRSSHA